MGAQQRTVGGGSATPVANSFNNFLQGQLGGTVDPYAAQKDQLRQSGMPVGMQQRIMEGWDRQAQNNSQQPGQQASAFQNLFNQAASGGITDQSGSMGALSNLIAQGSQGNGQFQNPYSSQQFQGANLGQLPTNMLQGSGMADLSGLGGISPTNVNVMQGFGQNGMSGLESLFRQSLSGGANPMMVGGSNVSMQPGMGYGEAYNTLGQDPLADRARMMAVADQRARFGAEGAGSLGTGAQTAEGNLNAQFIAQDASNRRGQAMQLMGQDLAGKQAGAGVDLQNAGLNIQAGGMNAGNMLQGQNMNIQALLSGRGQDLSTMAANRGMDINQLGMLLNQAQGNQGAMLQQRGQDMSGLLQNQGMGNQWGQAGAQLNSQNMQQNNANNMNMAGMQNNFNLQNAGNTAQFGLGTNQLNSQIGQNNMQNFLQALGMGQQANQFGGNMQQNLLQMLFGGMQQSNALGTPQAQTVMQPSAGSQLLGAGLGIGGALLGGPLGGMLGGRVSNMLGGGGFTPQLSGLGGSGAMNWGGANMGIGAPISNSGGLPWQNAQFGIGL